MHQGLVGDVGGTNARFAIAGHALGEARTWPTQALGDLNEVWTELSGSTSPPDFACVAVAAPVSGPSVRLTNADVTLDVRTLGIRSAQLVNDLEAAAAGIPFAPAASCHPLVQGEAVPHRPQVVMGLGTGLGVAFVLPGGGIVSGEGGHAPFAPACPELADFTEAFSATHSRPTEWEDVLCGRGLDRTVAWFQGERDIALGSDLVRLEAIAVSASQGDACNRATDAWVGAVADLCRGLALTVSASAVHICGGVAGHLGDALRRRLFAPRFRAPGPVSHILDGVPVYLITDDQLALRGCMALAS